MEPASEWMISVDDHVLEHPDVWQSRVSARHREQAPRWVVDGDVGAWVVEGKRIPIPGVMAGAKKTSEERTLGPVDFDFMDPACHDPVARANDMTRDGVVASLPFPTLPRFCGQTFHEMRDKELGYACVRAYNDWLIDEWCAAAPGRFIPCVIFPLWDPALGAAELERCAAAGARAFSFSENPYDLGLPSIHDAGGYWDPVLAFANESGLAVCTHLGSSSKLPTTSADAPQIISFTLTPMNLARTCIDWLFSGKFTQFPNLKLCLSEGGIGWIPYMLERAEQALENQSWVWGDDHRSPRELFANHVYGCFIEDPHGVASLDEIGIDNVMIECDFPHTSTQWPHSIDRAMASLAGRSPEDRWKIFQGTARRVFDFEPAPPPASRSAFEARNEASPAVVAVRAASAAVHA